MLVYSKLTRVVHCYKTEENSWVHGITTLPLSGYK